MNDIVDPPSTPPPRSKGENEEPRVEGSGKLFDGIMETFNNVADYLCSWTAEPVKEKMH